MITSFYSYKGGTGRSQLCANIAAYLCFEKGLKILLWDWDLEAPGLHYFFGKTIPAGTMGTIEMLQRYVRLARYSRTKVEKDELSFVSIADFVPLIEPKIGKKGKIDLIVGGDYSNNYAYTVDNFDWFEFIQRLDGFNFIECVKEWLQSLDYDYILIDSRTGIRDYSGICNIQLPDVSILLVTPQEQSFEGNLKIASRIQNSDYVKSGLRKPCVLPIFSRVDLKNDTLANDWAERFQKDFGLYYRLFFEYIQKCNPNNEIANRYLQKDAVLGKNSDWIYTDDTKIDYSTILSFGENIVFGEDSNQRYIRGFAETVDRIATMLENVKEPNPNLPNIRYSDLNKPSIYINNVQYDAEKDFKRSILWIRIENTNQLHEYEIDIVLKAQYKGQGKLGWEGERLLRAKIKITMPIQLRETFELYQYLTSSSSDPRKGQQQDLQKQQKKLASALQDTFFVGDIGKACHDFAQMLEKQRIEHLLFVISAGDETLFDFPFELTLPHFFPTALSHVNALITQSRFGLVRTTLSDITKFNTQPLTVSAAPLKILFIAALPTADLPDSEQLISAQHHLTEALAAIHKKHAPQILIEFLYPAALSEIEKALKTHQHHIVQLSAYAPIDVKQPILHLETETGENQPVSSHELGNLLRKHSSIQLLFLNLLSTPKTADVERFLSMYVPAIVSTRCSGEAALMTHATGLFTTQFYKNLLYGQALIPALNDAKKQLQLSLEVENQYLRTELFSIKTYLNQFTEQLIDPNAPFQTKKQFYTVRGFKPTYLIGDNFIGRRPYLIQLQNAFRDGKHVCLHGLGGVGKTTLAEAFLYQYAMQEKAVVIFFRNHSQINEKYILDALNRRFATIRPDIAVISQKVLDAPEKTFLQKLQTLIYHFRENDKLVILFDNCEDIQDNLYIKDRDLAIFLKYMCENAPKNCRLLFTTRYKMLDLETVVTHIELDKLSEIEQNRLLEQSPILKSIPREERAALYVRLDGHPRSYMYLEKILKKEKTFQWSQIERTQTQIFTNLLLQEVYDRLLPDEQALFQLMSCFITQTRISILAAIAQKSVADLTPFLNTFQEWALCNLDEKAGMFSIHYLTREWMNKNILTLDKRNDFYLTIGKFCLTLMPDNIANTTINIGYGLLAKNYFELAGKNGQKDFINTSFELEYHYRTMGAYAYALQLNDAVLKQNIDEVTNSDALNNKGVLYYLMGNYEKALENLEKSLEIRLSIKPKDKQRLSESYINVSLIYRIRDTFDKALKYLKKSFEYKTKLKDRKGISIIYNNKSQVFYAKGNFPKAKQYLEKCLNIQREIHDFKGMATVHNNLGAIAHQSGDIPEALKHLAEALKIQRQYDDVYQKVKTLEIMGTIYFEQQESPPEKAVYYLMSALAWLQRLELPTQAVYEKLLIIGEKEGENQFKAIVDKVTSNQYKI